MNGAERIKRFREKQRREGLREISIFVDEEVKEALTHMKKESGSYNNAIRQLLDRANS